MIVGSGLVAKAISKYDTENVIFFCSGVSDSKTEELSQFLREEDLLKKYLNLNENSLFVYISTYSINDPVLQNTSYILHKLRMEELIKKSTPNYLIVRTSNLFGAGGNSKTILPFLIENTINQTVFSAWKNASRNILDVDDLAKMIHYLVEENLDRNEIVNLLGPESHTIEEIIEIIEDYFEIKSKADFINKGEVFNYNLTEVNRLNDKYEIFQEMYLNSLLQKYYPKDL